MDAQEAKRIFTLTKSVSRMVEDPAAIVHIYKYVEDHESGNDNPFLSNLKVYQNCKELLQEEERPLTELELSVLCAMGIPIDTRKKLKNSVDGDRSNSHRIIQDIKESCINKIDILPELKEFSDYMYLQTE